MKKSYLLMFLLAAIFNFGYAQKTITGTVIDLVTNEPLPGVTIVVKENPTQGTVTNIDGQYTIALSDNAKNLVFSFIGYKTVEKPIGNNSKINVTLSENAEILDDVIVTAIGIKREKRELGYAAQNINSEELDKTQSTDMVGKLAGRVAGLSITQNSGEPGDAANIAIRGRGSLLGSNYPLIVIDGVPVINDITSSSLTGQSMRSFDINPEDIESISVLKGATAAALYGLRAADGVLMITTKKGKAGKHNSQITIKSSVTFENVNKLPERQDLYSQGNWTAENIAQYAGPEGERGSWGPLASTLFYDASIENPYDINGAIVTSEFAPAGAKHINVYDNVENFFATGVKTDNYVSVSGRGEIANYMASAGYVNHKGVIPNSEFERSTFRISGGTKLWEKVNLDGNMAYTNSNGIKLNRGSNASGVMLGLMRSPISFDITNNVSDPVKNSSAYMFPDGSQRTWYNDTDNPFWSVNKNQAQNDIDRFAGNVGLNTELFEGMTATYKVGIDHYAEEAKTYWSNGSKQYFGEGVLYVDHYQKRQINSDLILNYTKQINENWEASLMGGHNYFSTHSYYTGMEGTNFIIPDYYDISNVETIDGADDKTSRYRIVGAFYEAKVNFKNYLYLSTTGRNDWSSTLKKEEQSFFYPSVSASWIYSETFNLDKNPYLSYGKLRINYAKVAKDAAPYSLNNRFVSAGSIHGNTAFYPDPTMGNIDLKPEDTRSFEIGTDVRFLRGRLGLDVTYYFTETVDQIIPIIVPASTGFAAMFDNMNGTVTNNGIEILVNGTPIEKTNFKWAVGVNFNKSKNMVKKLPDGTEMIELQDNAGLATTRTVFIEGEPFGVLYGSRWMRAPDGQIVIDENGLPVKDTENGIIGDPNPDWTMGITNAFTYKDFTLDFLIDIKSGGDMYNGTANVMRSLGTHVDTENRDEEVVFDGVVYNETTGEYTQNTTPVLWGEYYQGYGLTHVSEAGVEDASWVRLKQLSLSYSLNQSKLGKLPIKGLTLTLSGNNLLLFTNYSGIDPETNLSGVSNSIGRDYFNMPSVRSYTFSVKMNF